MKFRSVILSAVAAFVLASASFAQTTPPTPTQESPKVAKTFDKIVIYVATYVNEPNDVAKNFLNPLVDKLVAQGATLREGPAPVDAPITKTNEQEWFSPKDKLPPEGVVVDTLNSAGQMTQLKLRGRLWWFADDSMYIYYVPTFWRLTCTK